MNKEQFWQLISEMNAKDETSDWLVEQLASRPASEIADYEIHFQTALKESYISSLWAAAYIIFGGCSDDLFDYFRGWLIACGKEMFESVLQNPENLTNLIPAYYEEEEIIPECEEILSVALEAFSLQETGDIEWDDNIWNKITIFVKNMRYFEKVTKLYLPLDRIV
ncbi:DUF4240 domain-containing protein [Bacillus pseudomycoides]|uniref:Molybdenum metabolism regulator n=2 Tax=Bacillus pseudomycoides TaxID=64104 RepID=A0A2B4M8L9_9BACI|nr:DUF4240 domain-containing protein [Bacillus pseudomycoides]PDY46364.1 molybdenum metabolism regulator [Bacillus pseudomycoides]PEA80575.1 molybdenum metabolism regulator [Bacillus pseudomycoides]PED05767.1 molybdenum metabolism regulator [Bacillus pseudomycoides]PED73681.1 molybdenum metabolism regulator [Bacillus pseudomycoides]PEI38762.1 molybdenum metabolism regulator [Bacillus pseudomycoides]